LPFLFDYIARGQGAGVRDQGPEIRDQRLEIRGQRSEIRGRGEGPLISDVRVEGEGSAASVEIRVAPGMH